MTAERTHGLARAAWANHRDHKSQFCSLVHDERNYNRNWAGNVFAQVPPEKRRSALCEPDAELRKRRWSVRAPPVRAPSFPRNKRAFLATSTLRVERGRAADLSKCASAEELGSAVTCCQYSSRDGKAEKYPVSCTIWSSWKMLHMGMTSISLPGCSHK